VLAPPDHRPTRRGTELSTRALVLDQNGDHLACSVQTLDDDALPAGDVTVRIEWSSVNYKDGMILAGIGRLVRVYPHVPGIDLAGVVESSDSSRFRPGDRVLCTGFSVGERWWGGYAERARLNSAWLVEVPESLTTRQTMQVGTAGLTAMLCVEALERAGLDTDGRPVLCTGAAGGVGSYAVHLLARLGYQVTASTGRSDVADHLRAIGARDVIDRREIAATPSKPLLSERWAGAVDAVGGTTLAHVIAEMRYGAAIAACGNAGGNDLPVTVLPFILRAVRLLGVDSVNVAMAERERAWRRIGELVDSDFLARVTSVVGLEQVPAVGAQILAGQVRGRVLVDVNM
jgi:acrylyl-CoA reductase (NADPH)